MDTHTLTLVLLIIAAVSFAAQTVGVTSRVDLTALGLLAITGTLLLAW